MSRLKFSSIDFKSLPLNKGGFDDVLFIFVSGYEKRSIFQASNLSEAGNITLRERSIVVGFKEFREAGSRAENDKFFDNHIGSPNLCSAYDYKSLQKLIEERLTFREGIRRIYIDYSSMPRAWYCRLFAWIATCGKFEEWYFFYSEGDYDGITDYPTVGYSAVELFSGAPRVNAKKETYVMGIGLDFRRSFGIWYLLDPSSAILAYAQTSKNSEIIDRILSENEEILSWSSGAFGVEIEKFEVAIAEIVSLARREMNRSDVILVPDGPKPLVLAFSIAPLVIDESGCCALHVGSVKPQHYIPVNIPPSGQVFGFSTKTLLF